MKHYAEFFMKGIYPEKKWKPVIKDEARVYLNYCSKKKCIYYHQNREKKKLKTWINIPKEKIRKRIVIVSGFAYQNKLKS